MTKRKVRPPKEDDQERIGEAVTLLDKLIQENSQIEATLWFPAIVYILICGYKNSYFSYDEFREEMDQAFEHYKDMFENAKDN